MNSNKKLDANKKASVKSPNNLKDTKKVSGKEPAAIQDVPLQKNIEAIMELEKKTFHSRSAAEHVADRVTKFAGSTPFIIFHILLFGGWILINKQLVPGVPAFDPFPFSFLTLVVSLEAIFLTLLVLMSQNRMNKEADKRAHLDLQVNLLAEQESTMILKMVHKIGMQLGIKDEMDESIKHLAKETDVSQVAKTLEEKSRE